MFRFIGYIIMLILLVFVVWFAVSNTDPVAFKMDILFPAEGYALPGFIWGFILIGGGYIVGMLATIAAGGARRKKSRDTKRELKQAKRSIELKDREIEKMQRTGKPNDGANPVAVLTAQKTTAK